MTVKEQPLPAVAGSVLLAENVTLPVLLPRLPVREVPVDIGQPVAASRDLQVPPTDTRPTKVPLELITTITVALQVTCVQQQASASAGHHNSLSEPTAGKSSSSAPAPAPAPTPSTPSALTLPLLIDDVTTMLDTFIIDGLMGAGLGLGLGGGGGGGLGDGGGGGGARRLVVLTVVGVGLDGEGEGLGLARKMNGEGEGEVCKKTCRSATAWANTHVMSRWYALICTALSEAAGPQPHLLS